MVKSGNKIKYRLLLLLLVPVLIQATVKAQTPDSRICNCFSSSVSPDFILAAKAFYGTIGITLSRNTVLKPAESQNVRFTIPALPLKQGCGAVYSITITDEAGIKVYETEDSHPGFSFSFPDCSKTYAVSLTASGKTPGGKDGNCTRRLQFMVKPECKVLVCNCGTTTSQSIDRTDMKFDGKITCLSPSATHRRYTIRYQVTNKSSCRLRLESVRLIGDSETDLRASAPVMPASTSAEYNMGFSAPLTAAVPSGGTVTILLKYFLNDRACSAVMKIPYIPCR